MLLGVSAEKQPDQLAARIDCSGGLLDGLRLRPAETVDAADDGLDRSRDDVGVDADAEAFPVAGGGDLMKAQARALPSSPIGVIERSS